MARTAYCTLSLKSIFQYGECNENSRNFEEGERVITTGISVQSMTTLVFLYLEKQFGKLCIISIFVG